MPEFTYEARDGEGRLREGRELAASAGELGSSLRERGWLVLDVRVAEGETRGRRAGLEWARTLGDSLVGALPVSMEEVEIGRAHV